MSDNWEPAPRHMIRLDIRSLLQDAAIDEVIIGGDIHHMLSASSYWEDCGWWRLDSLLWNVGGWGDRPFGFQTGLLVVNIMYNS